MTEHFPQTENEAYGFYGTMTHYNDAAYAWPIAMAAVTEVAGCSPDEARAFLDSRYGRHFADQAAGLMPRRTVSQAIMTTARDWNSRTTTRADERRHGIPAGLPLLHALAIEAAILAEAHEIEAAFLADA